MKKVISIILTILISILSINVVFAEEVTEITWDNSDSENKNDAGQQLNPTNTYLALGADLTPDQLMTVLSFMGLAGVDISSYNVLYITNADERNYLGEYVDSNLIGTKALSSVLVIPAEEGHGVQVTTKNINYCTEGMYRNALLTAGVKDADIMVVGPTAISGTSALIGALKAYEEMSGQNVTEASIDTALNELVATSGIAESEGNSEEISELVAFIKAEIAGKKLDTREEIEAAVRQAIKDYGASLTEDEIKQIVDVMVKIKELGIDYNTLLDQAEDLYAKFGDKLTLDDLSELGKEATGSIAKTVVKQFFTGIVEGIKGFFKGIFGKN